MARCHRAGADQVGEFTCLEIRRGEILARGD